MVKAICSCFCLPQSSILYKLISPQIGWIFDVNLGKSVSSCKGVASASEMRKSITANDSCFAIQLDLQVRPSGAMHYSQGSERFMIGSIEPHISYAMKTNYDSSQQSSDHISNYSQCLRLTL